MIITLITDFGSKDHFVGVMKGVILNINPQARIIDISHEVGAYQINEAAYLLQCSHPYFPERTVHLVVVDPGVGGTRRPIVVVGHGRFFVGPDNGVFSYLYQTPKKPRTIHLSAEEYFIKPGREMGSTFHGRDLFAPVAAWLSLGEDPLKMGREIEDPVVLSREEPQWTKLTEGPALRGSIIHIDRFGNLITNITLKQLSNFQPREITFRGRPLRLRRSYGEGEKQELFALVNSCGHLELCINQGNARETTQASVGEPILLRG